MSDESDRQRRLLSLLASERRMSTLALAIESRFAPRHTAKALGMLVLRGLVDRGADGSWSATPAGIAFSASGAPFRGGPLRRHGKSPAPRDTLRQRVWTAMRLHARFTLDDLVILAARPEDGSTYGAIQKYLWTLCKAGFVVTLPRRQERSALTSPGAKVYRLVRDTGERAPTITRSGDVIDRNGAAA